MNESQKKIDKLFLDAKLMPYFAGVIDRLIIENNIVFFNGWSVVVNENNSAPSKVYVLLGETILYVIDKMNVVRDDVADLYSLNKTLNYGFSGQFILDDIDNIEKLEIFVESLSGKFYHIAKNNGKSVQVELCGKCNLRCAACPSVAYSSFNNQDLTKEDIELISPLFEKAGSICFDGFGEALMSKQLENALSCIPFTKELVFHTNGMLLAEKMEVLIDVGLPLRKIIVSMDSLDSKQYSFLRKGGDLTKVIGNIKSFRQMRDSRKQRFPKIVPNMMVMKSTLSQIRSFIDLAAELDHMLELILLYDTEKMSENVASFNYENENIRNVIDQYYEVMEKELKYAKSKNVHIYFSGSVTSIDKENTLTNYVGKTSEIKNCPQIGNATCLSADGKFMFCIWQTSPVFDWKVTNNVDPMKNDRALKVIDMARNNIIPHECSGAGCQFIAKRLSTEEYDNTFLTEKFRGGWQK